MKEQILKLLVKKQIPLSAGAIAKRLNSNIKTVSLHLLALEKEKLIRTIETEIVIKENNAFIGEKEKLQRIKLYYVGELDGTR